MASRVVTMATCMLVMGSIMLASSSAVASKTAVATCKVSRATSPLSSAEAALVFGRWGEPPVVVPSGDRYFAPTPTTQSIEELNSHGRLIWQYPVSGPLVGWASTGAALVTLANEDAGMQLITVNLHSHTVTTTSLRNLNTYTLAATKANAVIIGTNGEVNPSGTKGVAYVLNSDGKIVRHWNLASKGAEGEVWAAAYRGTAYLAAQIINDPSTALQGGDPLVNDVVYKVSKAGVAQYQVQLPLSESGFQVIGSQRVLFFGQTPSASNPITDVGLSHPARIEWRAHGPVGSNIVTYGSRGYVSGTNQPGGQSLPTWVLNLKTGKKTGIEMRAQNAGVYPELAAAWGLIALVQRPSGNPFVALFSANGARLSAQRITTAPIESEQSTAGFTIATPTGAHQFFLSRDMPHNEALALPTHCSGG